MEFFLSYHMQRKYAGDIFGNRPLFGRKSDTIMDKDRFVAALRTALMQLDDLLGLRQNPLMPIFTKEQDPANPIELQRVLLDAIESLNDEPAVGSTRHYDILYYRYLEQLNQTDVAFQLGISVRQLRREQNNAIEYLADRLWRQFGLESKPNQSVEESSSAQQPNDTAIQKEIAWLSREFRSEPSQVQVELDKALAGVDILAKHHDVTLYLESPSVSLLVPVPPLAFRQALLTVLSTVVTHCSCKEIILTLTQSQTELLITLRHPGSGEAARLGEEATISLHTASQILAPFNGMVESGPGSVDISVPLLESTPILVIDDNPDARQLLQRYAANSRFRIITSGKADEAIEMAQQHEPKALILDIMMPEIDGWDLLTRWHHHPATEGIPVAVCTILPQEELSHLLGATIFIQKPVNRDSFLEALETLVHCGVNKSMVS
jgi:CheY-like chemotaxis protein